MVLDLKHTIDEIAVEGKRLGRKIEFDARSAAWRIAELHSAALRSVEWTRRAPVFDQDKSFTYQGKRYHGAGSCGGNAGAGAKGTDSLGRTGDRTMREKNAIELYHEATVADGFPGEFPPQDTGTSTLGVLKAMKQDGWIGSYLHAFSLLGIQTGLQQSAMLMGTNWYDSFDQPDSDGVITISPNAQVRGGHLYEILVLDLDRQRLGGVNSWGLGFAQRGHFWIPFAVADRLLHEHGDAGQPVWA